MLPSSVEEGMLWPKAIAGVVRPARVPTTPRRLPPVLSLLIQGGERFGVLMSYVEHSKRPHPSVQVISRGRR